MFSYWVRFLRMDKTIRLAIFLILLCLPAPFVFMKIGPAGYRNYGSDVPDIWILGAYILGKDTSFWGIGIVWKWQLFFIVYTAACLWFYHITRFVFWLYQNMLLLMLFPLWLYAYSGGVINNSDGADLCVYPMPGLLLWMAVLYLHLRIIYQTKGNLRNH
jgi:hypothetical protein